MLKLLRDILTVTGGEEYDIARVLWALAVIVLVMVGGTQVWGAVAHLFGKGLELKLWTAEDWAYWGGAIAVQMPAGGAAIAMKRNGDPVRPTPPPPPTKPEI